MAAEPADGAVSDRSQPSEESVSRLRGRIFEAVCAGSTVFGITVVAGLLLYVANDALRPFSADPEWHLVFFVTLVIPTLALAGYYLRRDRRAGVVAYTSFGIPIVSLLGGIGLLILLREIISAQEWFALLVALCVATGLVIGHRRTRPEAAVERLGVLLGAPVLTVFGVPALGVDYTVSLPLSGTEIFTIAFSTPRILPSIRDLVFMLPVLPADSILLIGTVSVPFGVAFGRFVASRRDDGRGVREMLVGSILVGAGGAGVAVVAGVGSTSGVLLATATLVPTVTYLEGVVRRDDGLTGLAFPVVVLVGLIAGILLTEAFGFTPPDPWLDWGFLTSPTSRTPVKAGIYPALVGSVLIVLTIALSAFPVGVGAAIYLEEYAPNTGRVGRLVDLIEINIGNLAGVPSVVYGLLGLALFVQGIGLRSGIVIVGGLTVGLLILPIVIISAQESIRAVPDSTRQASYGMGATRWQTVKNVVLPEAMPGIFTGTILALGRAIGETAPLLMIGIASSVRSTPSGFFAKTGAMPRQIFSWSSEIQPEFRFGVLAAGVVTLLAVLLMMNGTAIVLRNRHQERS